MTSLSFVQFDLDSVGSPTAPWRLVSAAKLLSLESWLGSVTSQPLVFTTCVVASHKRWLPNNAYWRRAAKLGSHSLQK